jgi:cytochrome oxidase Cu insertion factor (SCO1/SenC/PrrC family)
VKLGSRAKLLLLMGLFAVPIVASVLAYNFLHVEPTANYGELLSPPEAVTTQRFARPDGSAFRFGDLAGKWILVASDSGACEQACMEKLGTLRVVRLALGRDADRVERVFVVDDATLPGSAALEPFAGTQVALTPPGITLPRGAANDRGRIYLVDPNGNVMLRWALPADRKRMLNDLQRLLKASQIG